jgi:hypothetical protein
LGLAQENAFSVIKKIKKGTIMTIGMTIIFLLKIIEVLFAISCIFMFVSGIAGFIGYASESIRCIDVHFYSGAIGVAFGIGSMIVIIIGAVIAFSHFFYSCF